MIFSKKNLSANRLSADTLELALRIALDSLQVHFFGLPRFSGSLPEIAKATLRGNFVDGMVVAGNSHFRKMWLSDFAVALKGLEKVFSVEELSGTINFMIQASKRFGRVPVAFSRNGGFDAPCFRGDSFPSLLYAVWEFTHWSGSQPLFKENRPFLQSLLTDYEETHFGANGLIKDGITRDWVDTVDRPSSTFNNLWALKTFLIAEELGLKSKVGSADFVKKLLRARLKNNYFQDFAGTDRCSVDGVILTLYLGLFSKDVRKKLWQELEKQRWLFEPYPLRRAATGECDPELEPLLTKMTAPHYHEAIWPHLGLMLLNGLDKLDIDYSVYLGKLEELFQRYGNFLEVINPDGTIYKNILSCESGLTMTSGLYLELVDRFPIKRPIFSVPQSQPSRALK